MDDAGPIRFFAAGPIWLQCAPAARNNNFVFSAGEAAVYAVFRSSQEPGLNGMLSGRRRSIVHGDW